MDEKNDANVSFWLKPSWGRYNRPRPFYRENFTQKLKFLIFKFHRQDYTLNLLIFAREKRCNYHFLAKTIVGADITGHAQVFIVEILLKN